MTLPPSFRISRLWSRSLRSRSGRVVHQVAVAVGRDAAADEEELAAAEVDVGVAEVEAAVPDRLHLGADEGEAGLGPLEDLVVEERLPVRGEDVLARLPPSAIGAMLSRHIV